MDSPVAPMGFESYSFLRIWVTDGPRICIEVLKCIRAVPVGLIEHHLAFEISIATKCNAFGLHCGDCDRLLESKFKPGTQEQLRIVHELDFNIGLHGLEACGLVLVMSFALRLWRGTVIQKSENQKLGRIVLTYIRLNSHASQCVRICEHTKYALVCTTSHVYDICLHFPNFGIIPPCVSRTMGQASLEVFPSIGLSTKPEEGIPFKIRQQVCIPLPLLCFLNVFAETCSIGHDC
jgi:hypothetical protein